MASALSQVTTSEEACVNQRMHPMYDYAVLGYCFCRCLTRQIFELERATKSVVSQKLLAAPRRRLRPSNGHSWCRIGSPSRDFYYNSDAILRKMLGHAKTEI